MRDWRGEPACQADILTYGSIGIAVAGRFDNPEGEWAHVVG